MLAAHEAVRQCVVLAREASPGDLRLVAYLVYVAGGEPTASEIRGFVRKQLPDYMVPSVFVALEAIPSTPNGKTDRAALPDPFQGTRRAEASAEPPAPGLEQLLAEAWRDALKIERVGAHDNFFELGGHSLLALQVASVVERKTGWRLDPRALFFQSLRQVAAARPGTSP
ncbi:MAG: hypothetical protein IPL06_11730 [Betaproteobacteria bacterium]|nr:hypothetical protein [Betaproteobacteria bacterium]